MGVVPEAQNTGVGTWMMPELVAESKKRGEHRMELEVIETNAPGVRLYQKSGFGVLRRLVSFELSNPEEGQGSRLEEVDIREVAGLITAHGLPDLPWQVSGETIAQLGPPNTAYKAGPAYAVVTDTSADTVAIRTVIVESQARNQGQAARLLRGLMADFPGKQWKVPALCPEEMGELFKSVGFAGGPLAQFHMVSEWG
jgi:ribosomal protein S18 acetylase RimI-like enzyme